VKKKGSLTEWRKKLSEWSHLMIPVTKWK
jgi:hypothetical protein